MEPERVNVVRWLSFTSVVFDGFVECMPPMAASAALLESADTCSVAHICGVLLADRPIFDSV